MKKPYKKIEMQSYNIKMEERIAVALPCSIAIYKDFDPGTGTWIFRVDETVSTCINWYGSDMTGKS